MRGVRLTTAGVMTALLMMLGCLVATSAETSAAETPAAESPAVTEIRRFIAAHQSEELSLGKAARAVNLSDSYFCKVFKKATGLNFIEYLARQRIETAKEMLLNAHMRVSEAGFAAGFQSLSQFNRVFHRVAGEAPTSYRDRLHGVNGKATRRANTGNAASELGLATGSR